MKSMTRRILLHGGLFFCLLAVLYLILVFSAMLPNGAIRANMERSALFYGQAEPFQFHQGDRWNAIADNYADSILLNVAWHLGEGPPLTAAIDTDYYDGEELGENAGLYRSVTEGAASNTDYTRYWHGGAVFVRLCHLFTDVNGMKVLGLAAALALLGLNMVLLWRRGHGDLALLLALSLAAVQVWNIRLSLEYQTGFLVALALCPLYLLLEQRGDAWLTLLSTAGGVLIAFFDFLTTETLVILLPLLLVTAVRARQARLAPFRESLKLLVLCGLCWGGAYAGTFLIKWTAATLVTGENAFALALASAAERVGGAVLPEEGNPSSPLSAIAANLTVLFGGTARVQPGRVAVGMALALAALVSVWYLFRGKGADREGTVLVLLLGAVVFLRYLVLNNHSYLHEFFTYRALAAPILAVLLALRLNIVRPEKGGRRRRSSPF